LTAGGLGGSAPQMEYTLTSRFLLNNEEEKAVQTVKKHNLDGWYGQEPLIVLAVKFGAEKMVQHFVAASIDVNRSHYGDTLLAWSIYRGHENIARLLFAHGANLSAPQSTPALAYAFHCLPALFKDLVEKEDNYDFAGIEQTRVESCVMIPQNTMQSTRVILEARENARVLFSLHLTRKFHNRLDPHILRFILTLSLVKD